MTDEITRNDELKKQMLSMGAMDIPYTDIPQQTQQQLANQAAAVRCPQCGTMNDPESMYCASCGALLRMGACPNCGSEMDAEADFCEVCHSYVRHDVCSFCGAFLNEHDAFCPECGSPRGGLVCPVCHTLNEFSFCKQCGTPLTDEARQLVAQIKSQPDYQELVRAALDFDELEMQIPYASERELARERSCEELRERVLRLLAEDEGNDVVVIPPTDTKRLSKEELDARKAAVKAKIAELLERMAVPPVETPAKARNYAMAQKPVGVRLAWKCNYKQALHSSPCGCAKPQLGGKWVVLGHSSKQEIKDDK